MATLYSGTGYADGAFNPNTFPLSVAFDGAGSVTLSWDAVNNAFSYSVYAGRFIDTMLPLDVDVVATSATYSGFTQPTYCFQVIANIIGRNSISSLIAQTGASAGGPPGGPGADGNHYLLVDDTRIHYLRIDDAGHYLKIDGPVPPCSPLTGDVCYQMIQLNTQPMFDEEVDGPGQFSTSLDWSDDTECGANVATDLNGDMQYEIDHINIPTNDQKQRRMVFNIITAGGTFELTSVPAAAGDALPSGAFTVGTVITVDFVTDCGGNLTAAVDIERPVEPFCFTKLVTNLDYTGFDSQTLEEEAIFSYFDQASIDWNTTTTSCGVNVQYEAGSPSSSIGHQIIINIANVPTVASDDTRDVIINLPDAGGAAGNLSYNTGSHNAVITTVVSGITHVRFQPSGGGDVTATIVT